MPERFKARRYESGDENEINRLYLAVTGRRRTTDEWRWQWMEAPAGPADVFLIEHIDDAGRNTLVGHHGIMPLRFARGAEHLLFGKTENTMVLPRFRTALLYPRFEQRFLAEYEVRYHALFSTLGPATAIRLRKAMGYSYPVEWRWYLLATSLRSQLSVFSLYAKAAVKRERRGDRATARWDGLDGVAQRLLTAGFLDAELARDASAVSRVAAEARDRETIQPARDPDDLDWRFWKNPHRQHFAWIDQRSVTPAGVAILSINVTADQPVAFLDDYLVVDPRDAPSLIDQVLAALRSAGIAYMRVLSTTDTGLAELNRHLEWRSVVAEKAREKWMPPNLGSMPRKVTPAGTAAGLAVEPWDITGFVLEGASAEPARKGS